MTSTPTSSSIIPQTPSPETLQHPEWIAKCRKILKSTEQTNIASRVCHWKKIVNEKTELTNERLGLYIPNNMLPKFNWTINNNNLSKYIQFVIQWNGLKMKQIKNSPNNYEEYERKARNWLNGRRAPNYAGTLFPDMIKSSEQYANTISKRLFGVNNPYSKVYNKILMYGYLHSLCSVRISMNDVSKKTFLLCENSIKTNSVTSVLLQSYATDHPFAQYFPSHLKQSADYFQQKFEIDVKKYGQALRIQNNNIMNTQLTAIPSIPNHQLQQQQQQQQQQINIHNGFTTFGTVNRRPIIVTNGSLIPTQHLNNNNNNNNNSNNNNNNGRGNNNQKADGDNINVNVNIGGGVPVLSSTTNNNNNNNNTRAVPDKLKISSSLNLNSQSIILSNSTDNEHSSLVNFLNMIVNNCNNQQNIITNLQNRIKLIEGIVHQLQSNNNNNNNNNLRNINMANNQYHNIRIPTNMNSINGIHNINGINRLNGMNMNGMNITGINGINKQNFQFVLQPPTVVQSNNNNHNNQLPNVSIQQIQTQQIQPINVQQINSLNSSLIQPALLPPVTAKIPTNNTTETSFALNNIPIPPTLPILTMPNQNQNQNQNRSHNTKTNVNFTNTTFIHTNANTNNKKKKKDDSEINEAAALLASLKSINKSKGNKRKRTDNNNNNNNNDDDDKSTNSNKSSDKVTIKVQEPPTKKRKIDN